jgi:hypothetical protein
VLGTTNAPSTSRIGSSYITSPYHVNKSSSVPNLVMSFAIDTSSLNAAVLLRRDCCIHHHAPFSFSEDDDAKNPLHGITSRFSLHSSFLLLHVLLGRMFILGEIHLGTIYGPLPLVL